MSSPHRALLLTDVVDSTKLAERVGDQRMAQIWVAHDRAVRDLLAAWRGLEIDRTDGFLMLFEQVVDAVGFGTAVHAALAEVGERFGVPFAARVGVHWGAVILIESSAADRALGAKPIEVEGIAKPLAARVMSVAAGGQTLLTAEARAQLGPGVATVSHGHWRMKGVSEPVELFEVASPGVPLAPPPDSAKVYRVVRAGDHWMPVREVRSHLPVERDAFVGREEDLRALARLLDDDVRLVSVLGMGGTGKTRLVTRFAWTWLGDFPGGAWFCDLSEARSVEGIVFAVARALDVPLGKDDPVVQLGHAIAGRGECLVVLDNFEQVARLAPETVGRWLDRARDARFVVTTREVLGLPGESALPLAPLVADDASRLFVARARQAKPDFAPTDDESIRALVRLLDGLPLAIELAAARVRVMPPKTLLERMSQRFKLLASTGGRHTRQATLRATLDWSWELLSPDEQQALAQLSVFEGGFTLEAAEGVLALPELWPMDAVQALVDRSWVRRVADDRFDLLVSVQEYAAEKLEASGGRSEAETRHATWFARLWDDDALDALTTHGGVARRRELTRELDNLVAACRRSVARGAPEPAVALLRAAWAVLDLTGPVVQGLDLAEQVASMPGLSPAASAASGIVRAQALRLTGRMAEARAQNEATLAVAREDLAGPGRDRRAERIVLGDLGILHQEQGRMDEARAHFDAALLVAREDLAGPGRDRRAEGVVLGCLGIAHQRQGRLDEARAHYDAALAVALEYGDRRSEGTVRSNLGMLHWEQGQMDEASAYLDAALAVAREVGDRRNEGGVLGILGNLHWQQGRADEARAAYDDALAVAREVGDRGNEGIALSNLGSLHQEQGRMDEARAAYDAALTVHREVGDRRAEGHGLGNLGSLHAHQGRMDEARAAYEAALAVQREVGDRRSQGHVLGHLGVLHLQQGRIDEGRAHMEAALAAHREIGDRHHEGYVLGNLGLLHFQHGRLDEARAHFDAALSVARAVGDRRYEGHVLGNLGDLHREQGRMDEARAHLRDGERLLRAVDHPLGLAMLLCTIALLEAHDGDPVTARVALNEARDLAARVGAGPDTDLGRALAEARAAVESP